MMALARSWSPIASACALAVLLFLPTLSTASAAELSDSADQGVRVECSVDKADVSMGEVITYTLRITAPENVTVAPPDPAVNLGEFELRHYAISPPSRADGLVIHEAQYEIAIYHTGDYEIPAVTVSYTTAEGEQRTISSDVVAIHVGSLVPEEATEFRDLKGTASTVPDYSQRHKFLAGLGTVLVCLTLLGFYLYRRALRKRGWTPPAPPPPPPAETALAALAALKARDLINQGKIKEHFVELSEIIKQYLGARFQFAAIDRTSDEVLEELAQRAPLCPLALIGPFFRDCDLVKFAKWIPAGEQISELETTAEQIVIITRAERLLETTHPASRSDDLSLVQPANASNGEATQ